MKAIRIHDFGEPEVMRLEEVPIPIAGPGQVLIRTVAVGVNPIDVYQRAGQYHIKPPLPFVPGMDAAGLVEELGAGATSFRTGDRVYLSGFARETYAEFIVCDESQLHRLPENISFSHAAAVPVSYATAFRSLFQVANAVAGETILIHGASGGVGIAAIQLAVANGLRVIGTAGSTEGRKLVSREGAHHTLNHCDDRYEDELKDLTCGRGVDVVLEMAAHLNLHRDLEMIGTNGRIVIVGSRGQATLNPRSALNKDAKILAMSLLNTSVTEMDRIHSALYKGLESGSLRPVIRCELPLAQAKISHQFMARRGALGKIVLRPSHS